MPFFFLPGLWANFGVLANYTQVRSRIAYLVSPTGSATITDDLLNLSPKSYNATLYYDDGRFSARVSGSYRSGYLTRVPGQNNNDVEGTNKSLNVDASISYKWSPKLELTLEGVNLTNEVNDQFISRARNSAVVYNVTPSPAVVLGRGQSRPLTATATMSDGSTADVTQTVLWASSNLASVSIVEFYPDGGSVVKLVNDTSHL